MAGWEDWLGKKVYLEVRNGRHGYQGLIVGVDSSSPPLVFVTILDKFNKRVQFVNSEIILIKEEN